MVSFLDHLLTNVHYLFDHPLLLFILFFLASVLNTFFPPVPIETAVLLVSSQTGDEYVMIMIMIISSAGGMVLGNLILYFLFRRYGISFLSRTPLRKVIAGQSLQRAEGWFKKYGTWALFIGKFVPGMGLVMIITAGLFRFNIVKALLAFLMSNLIFFGALANIGKSVGKNWEQVLSWMDEAGFIALGIILFASLIYYFFYRRPKADKY